MPLVLRKAAGNLSAPLLAKALAIFTAMLALHGLLRQFHVIPQRVQLNALHQALALVEQSLLLAAALALWFMQPISAILFLVEFCIGALSFVNYFSGSIQKPHFSRPWLVLVVLILALAFEIARILYVWRVTRPFANY